VSVTEDAPGPEVEELRKDIEETRHELGETVEALAEKVDVKAQARAKADELKMRAGERPAPIAAGAAVVLCVAVLRRIRKRRRARERG
jgi:hypothetical protein